MKNESHVTKNEESLPLGRGILIFCLMAYVAVLSVSDTIALRNLLLLISAAMIFFYLATDYFREPQAVTFLVAQVPVAFLLWMVFLILFPLWAIEPEVAWRNLRGQWFETLMAWGVGFGAVWVLGRRSPGLWPLALASAFPVGLHLFLTLIVWAGLAGQELLVEPSLHALWLTVKRGLTGGSVALHWQPFPMGFRGIEPMHGNIGYAACQAIALGVACFFSAWQAKHLKLLMQSSVLMVLCFISIFVAYSRGAAFFGVLLVLIAFVVYRFKFYRKAEPQQIVGLSRFGMLGVGLALMLIAFLGLRSVRDDARWHSMFDKIELGVLVERPEKVLCEGLSEEDKRQIRERYTGRSQEYVDELISGVEGQDGARILLMRQGWELLKENPVGLDGSRQSYEKLMRKVCDQVPALNHAHAHQAWINLTLALGWLGGLLFAVLLGYFVIFGWRHSAPTSRGWCAAALFLIGIFWVLRGFFDAVYQDHYLQMQGFVMAFLFMHVRYDRAKSAAES